MKGDGIITSMTFAGTTYTFDHVKLLKKDDCTGDGWATSTDPAFRNQGDCVSSFASSGSKAKNKN